MFKVFFSNSPTSSSPLPLRPPGRRKGEVYLFRISEAGQTMPLRSTWKSWSGGVKQGHDWPKSEASTRGITPPATPGFLALYYQASGIQVERIGR